MADRLSLSMANAEQDAEMAAAVAEAAAEALQSQVADLVKLARANAVRKMRAALDSLALEAPEVVNARSDPGGWTCLHTAAYQGNLSMVKLLLSSGAKVTVRSHAGYTALDYAHRKGHAKVEDLLYAALQDEINTENAKRAAQASLPRA